MYSREGTSLERLPYKACRRYVELHVNIGLEEVDRNLG